jgi:hypothetical protein
MPKVVNPAYLAKVAKLSALEKERLMSRMRGRPRRREKDKFFDNEEALAFQLELEDEQLQVWREAMSKIREKENIKLKAKHAKEVERKLNKNAEESKHKINIKDIAPAIGKISAKKKPRKK